MTTVWSRLPLDEPVEVSAHPPEVVGGVRPDYTIDSVTEIPDLPLFAPGTAK